MLSERDVVFVSRGSLRGLGAEEAFLTVAARAYTNVRPAVYLLADHPVLAVLLASATLVAGGMLGAYLLQLATRKRR